MFKQHDRVKHKDHGLGYIAGRNWAGMPSTNKDDPNSIAPFERDRIIAGLERDGVEPTSCTVKFDDNGLKVVDTKELEQVRA